MKKISLRLLFLALLIVIGVAKTNAEEVWVGDLYYALHPKGTASVVPEPTYFELTDVVIPDSITYNGVSYAVTSIRKEAFRKCYGLKSVVIPNTVKTIGDRAFSGCVNLSTITLPNSIYLIGEYAFHSCGKLTSFNIPNSLTSIIEGTFYNCSGLKSVTIPNSVTSIGDYAFSGCKGLTSVTIGNSVTSIGYNAFYNCRGLTSVTIPNSVTTIGNEAFNYCKNLKSIKCYAPVPPKLDYLFNSDYNNQVTLKVPANSVYKYRSADGWRKISNIISLGQ